VFNLPACEEAVVLHGNSDFAIPVEVLDIREINLEPLDRRTAASEGYDPDADSYSVHTIVS